MMSTVPQPRNWAFPIVITTDAHSVDGLDVMRYGVLQARRARPDQGTTSPIRAVGLS